METTMDIPQFVSMSAPQAQARARARACSGGRRTTRGSSSESSSQASSSTASPVASPRATARDSPGEDMEGVDAAASAGIADLHVEAEAGGATEQRNAPDDPPGHDAMQTDAPAGTRAGGTSDPAGEANGADRAEDSRAGPKDTGKRSKQFEFDGEGWEDVGDSGDEEDQRLLGMVGQGEDDYYDPDMDDLDQQFVDNRRRRHMPPGMRPGPKPRPPQGRKAKPCSAASCPASQAESGMAGKGKADAARGGSSPMPHATAAQDASASDAGMHDDEADEQASSGTSGGAGVGARVGADAGVSTEGASAQADSGLAWTAYVAASGHEYYHNTATGETTWIKPDGFEGDGAAIKGPETKTDAILSCPCCFAIVCLDCQRHAKFLHQYRAVFVQNCQVLRTERLRAPGEHGGADSLLYPVRCKSCEAQVGVVDEDEVFHFYDVIPSNG